MGKEGCTVLFVSHNLNAIKRIFNHGLYLHNGELLKFGNSNEIYELYLHKMSLSMSNDDLIETIRSLPPDKSFRLLNHINQLDKMENDIKTLKNSKYLLN